MSSPVSTPQRPRIALVTAHEARTLDEDLLPLASAINTAGADADIVEWDNDTVDWGSYDLAVLRSTWDYTRRLADFLTWATNTATVTTLVNSADVVRWNTDKHYLADLAKAGIPVVPSAFIDPGDVIPETIDTFLEERITTGKGGNPSNVSFTEFVVKPTVGAGAQDAQRYSRTDNLAAHAHVKRLIEAQRGVLLQPYLDRVDDVGETALIYLGGTFSHAIRKAALLPKNDAPVQGLFATEAITPRTPDPSELRIGDQIIAAIPFGILPYTRIDLIRDAENNPCVLELELTEPSLFLGYDKSAADRCAAVILDLVHVAR